MLDSLIKIITRILGLVAGSLTGVSVILTATGYLAERSHLKMLGFTGIPVDLNQYLYTGALFWTMLPSILVLQTILLLFEPWAILLLLPLPLWRFSSKIEKSRYAWAWSISLRIRSIFEQKRVILALLVILQILALSLMSRATLVENLLFVEASPKAPDNFTFLAADDQSLTQLVLHQAEGKLQKYFVQLFLLTLAIGLTLRYALSQDRENQKTATVAENLVLGLNLILFSTQIILLPINYGALLLNKRYQEAKIQFKEIAPEQPSAPTSSSAAEKNLPPEPENPIRNQFLEIAGLPFEYDLNASPATFKDPDNDSLSYDAKSDAPKVALATVQAGMLKVSPLTKGSANITVYANDAAGEEAVTIFSVRVLDEIETWGAEVGTSISRKTMVVGEQSFVRDLFANPAVFRILDEDSLHLTFKARSSAPEVGRVAIAGNTLIVEPISKGIANITVTAHDGYGRSVSTEFEIVVLSKNLVWPEDGRLLLIHKSSDIFYLYSRREKRIWYVRAGDIKSMVHYGLADVFQPAKSLSDMKE
ncbi:hypothetical protein DCC62_03030 [candidate division KSB1 bacterium]|nr:MAG: hypothetical protein DCC62_03030 [candidate division KSB1 bacterium]